MEQTEQSQRILVLMPCYNEQGRITDVIQSIRNALPSAHIILINDASDDSSADEAALAGATVLTHGCNLGYGAALETGYIYAVENDFDIVLQMDADGQHLAHQLHLLAAPILNDSADLVIGSRYGNSPDGGSASSPIKHFGHRLFAFIVRMLSGLSLSDPTSGFQALNRKALALFSSEEFPCDYPDSDVILMASMSGLRIMEVPVTMKERLGGTSMHDGIEPFYYAIKMLFSMFVVLLNKPKWYRWRQAHSTPPTS